MTPRAGADGGGGPEASASARARSSRLGGVAAVALSGALLAILSGGAAALQESGLAARILAYGEGEVRMEYAVREGVELCPRGDVRIHRSDEGGVHRGGVASEDECGVGPAVVWIRLEGGEPRNVRVRRGAWTPGEVPVGRTVGRVAAPEAARALLELARRFPRSPAAGDAVFGAAVADSATVWPTLLELARNRRIPPTLRKSALFWTAQVAADSATAGLEEIAVGEGADLEVREAAIFALSRLPPPVALETLIEVARSALHPRLRRKAFFWLARIEDPRVTDFFERVLAGSSGR